jgi:hypothetical protein
MGGRIREALPLVLDFMGQAPILRQQCGSPTFR